jgi:ABC-type multidrug transport system fused ATPase/permease subunit
MNPAQIRHEILSRVKIKSVYFWFFVRFINTFFPLAITWIYAKGVETLENGGDAYTVMQIFALLLFAHIMDNLLRIGSRARIRIKLENAFIEFQEALIEKFNHSKKRIEIVQAIRNLTDAFRNFVTYIINSGLPGFVNFVSIPVILFLIDVKIFIAQMVLIAIYLALVYYLSRIYEKRFELLDVAHENYYASILARKPIKSVDRRGNQVKEGVRGVENITFMQWVSFQDIIAIFQFIVIYLIVLDYVAGTKQISDLVLIVGYTNQSQGFLNSVTSGVDSLMQIEAGVDRVVETTNAGEKVSAILEETSSSKHA